MNTDYRTIAGNATANIDGVVLTEMLKELNSELKILELGTFYGRHAILWLSILHKEGKTAEYYSIDEEGYLGALDARISAGKTIQDAGAGVNLLTTQSFLEITDEQNAILQDKTFDILHFDIEYSGSKIHDVLSKWLCKLAVGGFVTWYIASDKIEQDDSYKSWLSHLESRGCEVKSHNDIRFARLKEDKTSKTKQTKQALSQVDRNFESNPQEKK